MNSSDWVALLAVVISATLAVVQISKHVTERRAAKRAAQLAEDHADVKRETVIVANSEQAVAVLGSALKAAQSEIDRRDQRIARLEEERELDRARIDELEKRIRELERLTS